MSRLANVFSHKKIIFVFLAALVIALVFLIYKSVPVQTRDRILPLGQGPVKEEIVKNAPSVLVTRDDDGHGLQIMAKDFRTVKKVEMLVGYTYKGIDNPPLLASGPPQQNSYWAHFRFESCSRGDCIYYKISEAKFQLTLKYEDGESRDYTSVIKLPEISKDTLISLNPSL